MRTRVILNPYAGNAHQQQAVSDSLTAWRSLGWQVELVQTEYAGHAIELARRTAAEGFDLAVAAGGDGTINEVVNGLAHTETALGVLPVGTGNVWVRELRLPSDPLRAAQLLADGTIAHVDLGMAGERYFLLMSGVGFDAAVTRAVLPQQKRRLGVLSYVLRSVALGLSYSGGPASVTIDGTQVSGEVVMVLVSNSRLYGRYFRIAHRAAMTDGLLDVCLLRGKSPLAIVPVLLAVLLRGHGRLPAFRYYQGREIVIECGRSLHVQVDGDTIGSTPVTYRVAPLALRVLLPPGLAAWELLEPPAHWSLRLRHRLRRALPRPSKR